MLKSPLASAADMGSNLVSGRSPGEENDNLLQYSCLENVMDRGAWQAGGKESDVTEHTHTQTITRYILIFTIAIKTIKYLEFGLTIFYKGFMGKNVNST